MNQKQLLREFLRDIQKDALVVYSTSSHKVTNVNLGAGQYFEIHYYEDDDEINEAFFISHGHQIELDQAEINVLSRRF